MAFFGRRKNRWLARLATAFPAVADRFVAGYTPREFTDIPWCPMETPVSAARIALVTTAGVHHRRQPPFDMHDPDGDPTFRELDGATIATDAVITHDYYNHADADRDLNVVFPIDRLREMADAGRIGAVADRHYGFMGHIVGDHIPTLVRETAPAVADRLVADRVDAVVLTPG